MEVAMENCTACHILSIIKEVQVVTHEDSKSLIYSIETVKWGLGRSWLNMIGVLHFRRDLVLVKGENRRTCQVLTGPAQEPNHLSYNISEESYFIWATWGLRWVKVPIANSRQAMVDVTSLVCETLNITSQFLPYCHLRARSDEKSASFDTVNFMWSKQSRPYHAAETSIKV